MHKPDHPTITTYLLTFQANANSILSSLKNTGAISSRWSGAEPVSEREIFTFFSFLFSLRVWFGLLGSVS